MSKRESSIGFVFALVVTFGLSAGGIWWAHQFGFGTHSSVENQLQAAANSSESTTPFVEDTQIPVNLLPVRNSNSAKNTDSKPIPTPTVTATPSTKKSYDLENFPVIRRVKFVVGSAQTTNKGEQVLERLVQEIKNFNPKEVAIKISVYEGESESSKTLAQQRGNNIAGYLRDSGLGHKIFISNRSSWEDAKQTRNPPLEVRLLKR